MALRTSTMSMPFSNQHFEEQDPEQYHLLRKLVILLLLVTSASLWIYILLAEGKLDFASTPVQEIGAGVCIAFVACLGAQLVLSKRDGFFRFVAAMAGDVAGIYLLGFVSDGKYGISEFGWLPKSVDYDGLNLIGLGFVIVLFILLVFRRTKTVVIPESLQVSPSGREPEISSVQIEPLNSAQGSRVLFPRVSWSGFFMPGSQQPERSNGRSSRRIQPSRVKPMAAPKRSRRRGKARVQLALVEEHRCPYCLELVSRSDPHGVVECKVCHTLHHKDCWDITGSCQVPHLNT